MEHHRLAAQAGEILARLRQEHPLVHHITNLVVMNDTANVTLHLGGLPVMSHAIEEVSDMVSLAGALVLNPGTLTPEWVKAMMIAGRKANDLGVPIVLDPVGAGATRLRTECNLQLLKELSIAVLRGNAGEIGALAGAGGEVKGVESVKGLENPLAVAKDLATRTHAVVVITGPRDILSDGSRSLGVDNGHAWLATTTGTGCMSTAAIGTFCAAEKDPLMAAAGALACYGLSAEMAAPDARGPASFKVNLLDALYNMTPQRVAQGARIVELGE